MRLFIAVEVPARIQDDIAQQTTGLRQSLGRSYVRWVEIHNVHLTLKFLGEVSPNNLEMLKQMLLGEAAQHPAFSMTVGGLGIFPSPRRPRVVWIGIEAPPVLEGLQRGIETAAARLGYQAENRPFSPHLTIGRVNPHATPADLQVIRSALEGASVGPLGTSQVDAVHLFHSDLRPTGAVYTPLFCAPLSH